MPSRLDTSGDAECAAIAISIAVPCDEVRNPRPSLNTSFSKRCQSAPDGLSSADFCAPDGRSSADFCRALRRSPSQSRHRFQRRRVCNAESSNPEAAPRFPSALDLSALDFSLKESEAHDLSEEERSSVDSKAGSVLRIGLNECDITTQGIETISRALSYVRLADKKPLVDIRLAYNRLGNQGISSLLWAAEHGALMQLRCLVLTANDLSDTAGLASAFARGDLPALTELALSSNRIRADGVRRLAHATLADGLPALGRLERLSLDHNDIGTDSGTGSGTDMSTDAAEAAAPSVAAVGALANACESVRTLDLSSNCLDDTHVGALAAAISSGRAFSRSRATSSRARLDISLNRYSLAGHQRLSAACDAHGGVRCSI